MQFAIDEVIVILEPYPDLGRMNMTEIHQQPTETTIDGPRSRKWELGASDCPELSLHRIARVGLHEAMAPYRRVRLHPSGSFLMVCFAGQGRVLLDGRWRLIRAGTACMAPPRILNAFAAASGHRWAFAWIRYDEPPPVHPMVNAASPVCVATNPDTLRRVLEGLRDECQGARDTRAQHHWIELLQSYARRLAQPWQVNERLWKLWAAVGKDLAAQWTLELLASRCHMSKENLRRLCLRELGRSPMQQLTYMRMQHAQALLEETPDKLDVIARQVGYDGALVFSRAFKRWVGCNPSAYRGLGKTDPSH